MSKRGFVGAVIFVLVAAVALPSSAVAAGWLPPSSISNPGEDDSESFGPDVAVAPDGTATAVWADEFNLGGFTTGTRIQSRTFFPDGSQGPIRTLSASVLNVFADEAQVDYDGQGVATVAWSRDSQVEFIRLDPDGAPIGSPEALSPGGESAFDVDLDVSSAGEALVSWINTDANQAQFRRIAANGSLGSVTDLSSVGGSDSIQSGGGIAIDDQGRGFGSWSEFDGDTSCCEFLVQGRTIDPDDSLDPIRLLSNDTSFPDELSSVVDSQGTGTAVWYGQDTITFTNLVYANRIDAAGDAGSTQIVSDDTLNALAPDAAVGANDAVTVLYEESDAGPPFEEHVRTRQLSGAGLLSPTVNTIASGDVDPYALALAPQGSGLVAYTSGSSPSTSSRAAARPIDSAGAAAGPEALLSDDGRDADELEVGLGANGSGFASWSRPNPDFASSDYDQVEGAAFDGTPPQLRAVLPGGGRVGDVLVMAATASDRSKVTFQWSFGDGSGASGDIVQHAYSATGTYPVSVTATDAVGNASSGQGQLAVAAEGAKLPGTGKRAAALKKCQKIKKKRKKKRRRCVNRAKRLPI